MMRPALLLSIRAWLGTKLMARASVSSLKF
ncbi:hypothetical protein BC938DRAFT_480060 [Jimgerdemannia flammicorona]|uniref:Uncharacterized protein n=1 Tax=Jimgerdemannia flammicorona TaxID=994334 RepID=A0A433QJH0_9FUNG|nr:hypothetical protein BC938DRAFT_480060 [Jimgerdemannia flammicorona]